MHIWVYRLVFLLNVLCLAYRWPCICLFSPFLLLRTRPRLWPSSVSDDLWWAPMPFGLRRLVRKFDPIPIIFKNMSDPATSGKCTRFSSFLIFLFRYYPLIVITRCHILGYLYCLMIILYLLCSDITFDYSTLNIITDFTSWSCYFIVHIILHLVIVHARN